VNVSDYQCCEQTDCRWSISSKTKRKFIYVTNIFLRRNMKPLPGLLLLHRGSGGLFLTWIYFLQVLCLEIFVGCACGAGFLWVFLVFCLVNSLKLWFLFLVISARALLFAPFPRFDFKLSSLFKLKALCIEYRAICSVAEGPYGPIYQYIIQEMCVVIRHELLIY